MINRLSVIVPCFNEEGNVPRFKPELLDYFSQFPFTTDFIFVDDGSVDSTLQQLESLAKNNPQIKIVRHETNMGLGIALQTGLKEAGGDACLVLDSDLTFHPSEFPKLLELFSANVDCVLGSPNLGSFSSVPLFRRILSQGVNFIYRILLGRNITSTSSIFRLYRSNSLKHLQLKSKSFDINAEILFKLILNGYSVCEAPVTLTSRVWGRSKIKILREVMNHMKWFLKILFWRLKSDNQLK